MDNRIAESRGVADRRMPGLGPEKYRACLEGWGDSFVNLPERIDFRSAGKITESRSRGGISRKTEEMPRMPAGGIVSAPVWKACLRQMFYRLKTAFLLSAALLPESNPVKPMRKCPLPASSDGGTACFSCSDGMLSTICPKLRGAPVCGGLCLEFRNPGNGPEVEECCCFRRLRNGSEPLVTAETACYKF